MYGNYYSNSGRILFRHHPERMDGYHTLFWSSTGSRGFNTAIERLVNLVSPERNPIAGDVKDIAAGSVLICAIVAAIVGIIIFMPYVLAVLLCNMG